MATNEIWCRQLNNSSRSSWVFALSFLSSTSARGCMLAAWGCMLHASELLRLCLFRQCRKRQQLFTVLAFTGSAFPGTAWVSTRQGVGGVYGAEYSWTLQAWHVPHGANMFFLLSGCDQLWAKAIRGLRTCNRLLWDCTVGLYVKTYPLQGT